MSRTAAVLTALVIGGLGALAAHAHGEAPAVRPPDVAACYDGTCTLTVTAPLEIPLDGRAGYPALSITDIRPSAVAFAVRRAGSAGIGTVSAGGTSTFGAGSGTLTVHVLEISGSTARLEITTTVP
ncbi:hypothetical protein GCM10009609_73200 [Pseudonocardia aurantiaca]|uniref:Uncharacterized protein n=1 Tax=Pseudonocardia aurantiaca TaxID=75290 RepID=A0ABW4FKQ2_9PSEU